MKKLITICSVVALTLILSPVAMAMITADADGFADGTDISTAYAGVTLSFVGPGLGPVPPDGLIYARTATNPAHASTGANVFGNNQSGTDTHGNPYDEIWGGGYFSLRADFQNPANYVSIDIIGNNAFADWGNLEAYDSGGTLLATIANPIALLSGDVYTAQINRASYDIAYIIATGSGGESVHLDNLQANVIPAPGAILLGSIGVGLVGWLRRRRTL